MRLPWRNSFNCRKMKKVLVLDNYDSFTFNLVHILRELDAAVSVYRNDEIAVEEASEFSKILISPGPGMPEEAGILKQLVRQLAPTHSLLGVCLGHQGIAEVFGATLFNIPRVLHGVTSVARVIDPDDYLFAGVSPAFQATHYHSWAVVPHSVPPQLKVTAVNDEGLIMAIRHEQFDVRGVQFHPESILTTEGPRMIANWLNYN